MKKIISLLLLLTLTLSVAGCKQKKDDEVAEIPKEEQAVATDTNETQQKETDTDSDDVQTEETVDKEEYDVQQQVDTPASESDIGDAEEDEVLQSIQSQFDAENYTVTKSETGDIIVTEKPRGDTAEIELDLRWASIVGTDLFTAEVLEKQPLDNDIKFKTVKGETAAPVKYTVKVDKVYKDFVVTSGATIDIISFEIERDGDNYWVEPLEIGSSYIFGGWIDTLDDKVVITSHGMLLAEIKDDGSFGDCYSKIAQETIGDIKTLDEFEKSEDVSDVLYTATENILLDDRFYEYTNKKTAEEVKAVLKEAIKVDSDVKLNIK